MRHLSALILLVAVFSMFGEIAGAQPAGTQHALVIGGLGGSPEYTDRFDGYLRETRAVLVDQLGFAPDNVHVLGERADEPHVDGASTAENIEAHFSRLAEGVGGDDHVFVLLFGHGSFDGTNARLNIPRQDLADVDYANLVASLDAGRVVFVNTASASGPFAEMLSETDRIVITATATGNERDETNFPRFFIEALRDGDLDKDGAVSVREAFQYAARQTRQAFENAGQIATEHALIDDDGDGSPSRLDAVESGTEGNLAGVTYFQPPGAAASVPESARPLLREKEELEQTIAELKGRKQDLSEEEYYSRLETLFVQLARLNNSIEAAD